VTMCSHGVRHGQPRVGSHQYIQSLRSRRLSRGEQANHHLELSHRETSAVVRHEEHQVEVVEVGELGEQHKVMHKVGGRIGSIQLAGLQPIPNNEERQAAEDVLLYSEDEVSEGMVHLLEFDRDEDTIIDFQQLSALHGSIWNGENKETLLGSRRLKATADILKDFNAEESQQHLKILGSRRLGAIYQVLSEGVQEVSNSIEGAAKGMAEGFEGAKKGVSDGIEGAMNFVSSGLDDKKSGEADTHAPLVPHGLVVPEVSAASAVEPAAAVGAAEEAQRQAAAHSLKVEAKRDKNVLCQEMEMAADSQQIYLVASELEHYKDWAGDGIKSVNIRLKDSDYIEAVYKAGAFGYIFDFVMGFTLEECKRITFHVGCRAIFVRWLRCEQMVESSMIKRLEGAYVFEPLDNFKWAGAGGGGGGAHRARQV